MTLGRIKVAEYVNAERFQDALDSMVHNHRVKVLQFGPRADGYYIVYDSIHERSPREGRKP